MGNGYIQFVIHGVKSINAAANIFGSSEKAMRDPNTIVLRAFTSDISEKADKVYKIIIDIYNKYQNTNRPNVEQNISVADEIRKFKQLLNDGIISNEEYVQRKKTLLG